MSTAPGPSGAPPRASREIVAGQSWLTTLPEPDEIEPALAEALSEHERTPPPRGATVPLSVIEAPAGSGVWVGKRRIASAPAWMLVESHVAVRLSAPARGAAPPAEPFPSPSTEPAQERSRPGSEPPARATTPAGPRALVTRAGAEPTVPTEPPAFAPPEEMTAQTLFREADAARAAGDTGLALRTLRALVERFPRESGNGGRALRAGAHGRDSRPRGRGAARPGRGRHAVAGGAHGLLALPSAGQAGRPRRRSGVWPISGADSRPRRTTPTRWEPRPRWRWCAAGARRRRPCWRSSSGATRSTARPSGCAPRAAAGRDRWVSSRWDACQHVT